jgi:3-methyladenine DNA glycosylase AlkD
MSTHPITTALKAALVRAANPSLAPGMEAYMKHISPFYGVKSVPRKELLKTVSAAWKPTYAELEEVVREWWGFDQREWQYCAMEVLLRHKKTWPDESIALIEWIIVNRCWWDTVDALAAHHAGYYFEKYPKRIPEIVPEWIQSPDMWLNRSAILFQLRYKQKTDTRLLEAAIVPHIGSNEFFLRKSIGWALRAYSGTDPAWVRRFADSHPLNPLSRKEALRLIGG